MSNNPPTVAGRQARRVLVLVLAVLTLAAGAVALVNVRVATHMLDGGASDLALDQLSRATLWGSLALGTAVVLCAGTLLRRWYLSLRYGMP